MRDTCYIFWDLFFFFCWNVHLQISPFILGYTFDCYESPIKGIVRSRNCIACGWVNDGWVFIFGWTIPLSPPAFMVSWHPLQKEEHNKYALIQINKPQCYSRLKKEHHSCLMAVKVNQESREVFCFSWLL